MTHKKLFIPGPTEVLPDILEAMAVPMFGHRSKDYSNLQAEVVPKVKKCLYAEKSHIILSTSSSTGLMEASVRNFANKKVLACMNGAFSDRWAKISKSNGKETVELKAEWGKAIKPEMIEEQIKKGGFDLVLFVYNETSTAVMSPLKDVLDMMKNYPDVLVAIDAVSCMMATPIYCDEWGVDFILAGVQKAWSLPPGLAIGSMSEKALERAKTVPNKGYYFDLPKYVDSNAKNQTPETPCISQINALNVQCTRILDKEGLDNRWARHIRQAKMVQDWALSRGFEIFAEKGYWSVALTTITNNKNIDIAALNSELGKRGKTIANGYGDLKDKTFRISHMGDIYEKDLVELLADIDDILKLK
jgi:predicted phosphoserine aminotransferase